MIVQVEVGVGRPLEFVLLAEVVDVGLAFAVALFDRADVTDAQADLGVLFDAVVAVVVVAGREPDPGLDPEPFGRVVADQRDEAGIAPRPDFVATQRDDDDRQV